MGIRVINIEDFGAAADGKTHCTGAIIKALDYAKKTEDKIYIIFKKGKYFLNKPDEYKLTSIGERYLFRCELADNVHLEGDETELIIEDSFCGLFQFSYCSNISISGFKVKHLKAPWAQCEVKEINCAESIFDAELLNDTDILDDERLMGRLTLGFLRDKNNPRLMKHNFYDFFGKIKKYEKIANRVYRFTLDDERGLMPDNLEIGDKVIFNNRPYGGSILNTFKCESVSVCNCDIFSSSGGVYISSYTRGRILINKVNVMFENETQWLTANADAFHFQHGMHSVEITDCIVEGINDDVTNLYQIELSVTKVFSENEIEITNINANWLPEKGEKIIIFNNSEGRVKTVCNVSEVCKLEENKRCRVKLEKNVKGLKAGESRAEGDAVYSADALFNNVEIRNNVFRSSRRFGMLIRCANAYISKNKFYDLGGSALYSFNENCYNEGLGIFNLVFCDNYISNTAYTEEHGKRNFGAAFCIRTDRTEKNGEQGLRFAESRVNTNLLIENNTVNYKSRNGIVVACAQNVIIRNNKMNKDTDAPDGKDYVTENVLNCIVEENE